MDKFDDVVIGWPHVAAALGRSVRTAQRWAKEGLISVHKIAGTKPPRILVRRSEIDTLMERNACPSSVPSGADFAQKPLTNAVRLHEYIWGWKAIAGLLNLSVSTVQLWEREAKLPIRRFKPGRRAVPYVLESEILAWIKERAVSLSAVSKADRRLPLLMHSFLDAWPAHIAVLDAVGTIIAVNKAWRVFCRSHGYPEPSLGLGMNYFEICGPAVYLDAVTASQVADGLAELAAGKRLDLAVQYRSDNFGAEKRDFLLNAVRFEGLTSPFFVIFHLDMTEVL